MALIVVIKGETQERLFGIAFHLQLVLLSYHHHHHHHQIFLYLEKKYPFWHKCRRDLQI